MGKNHASQYANFGSLHYDRPCDLQIKRSTKNDEFIGICFKVENEASVYFLNAILRDIQDSECYINF